MTPQDGVGGWTPTPRNERPASTVIAAGRSIASRMNSGAMMFGQDVDADDAPVARAQSALGVDVQVLLGRQHERSRDARVAGRERRPR